MAGNATLYDWRDRIENGSLVGPRMVVAGRLIDGTPTLVPVITVDGAACRRTAGEGGGYRLRQGLLAPVAGGVPRDRGRGTAAADHLRRSLSGRRADPDAGDAGERSLEHLHALALSVSSRENDVRRMIAGIKVENGDYPRWFDQMHPIEWLASRTYDAEGCR